MSKKGLLTAIIFLMVVITFLIYSLIVQTNSLKEARIIIQEQANILKANSLEIGTDNIIVKDLKEETQNLKNLKENSEVVLTDLKELNELYLMMLKYNVTYIRTLQLTMQLEGLDYPEWIVDYVLTDEFFEENLPSNYMEVE